VSLASGGTPLTLGYGYCAGTPAPAQCAGNNGNVQSASILAPGPAVNVSQTFGYDTLNRLTSAVETPNSGSATTAWSQLYNYDAFGNRWLDPGSSGLPVSPFTPQYASNFGSGNNRLGIQNSTYDLAGNQTAIGGFTYSYDAENRVSVVTEPSPTTPPSYRYVYDGEGRRVQKIASGGPTTSYAYDAAGNLAAEYTSATTAGLSCATCYLMQDTLGSTRLVLDATTGSVAALHDYLPFGEELVSSARPGSLYAGNDNPKQKFTGKERDAETGLDFFGARYFSGAQGRFTSPDEPFADQSPADPQSWNMYAYVRNNPLKNTDPNGRDCFQGVTSCLNWLGGVVGAVGNAVSSDIINTPNRLINAAISPFTNSRLPDAVPAAFTPANGDQQEGMAAGTFGMLASPLGELGASATTAAAEVPLITRNAAQGKAFQNAVAADTALSDTNVAQNVTVRTQSGVRTQIDVVSTNAAGDIALREAKSSATAGLTPNQAAAHPDIANTGATVVGRGKPSYPGGTQIPPTTVQVVRPPQCPGGPGCPR
jgi:RHS repeat-associated protein